jgi:hypothetical protein
MGMLRRAVEQNMYQNGYQSGYQPGYPTGYQPAYGGPFQTGPQVIQSTAFISTASSDAVSSLHDKPAMRTASRGMPQEAWARVI